MMDTAGRLLIDRYAKRTGLPLPPPPLPPCPPPPCCPPPPPCCPPPPLAISTGWVLLGVAIRFKESARLSPAAARIVRFCIIVNLLGDALSGPSASADRPCFPSLL